MRGLRPPPFWEFDDEEDLPAEAGEPEEQDLPGQDSFDEGTHELEKEQDAFMRRVLEYDPETGTTIWHEYDHATKTTTLYEEQETAPYLERNSRLMSVADKSKQIKNSWWHVASIPNTLIAKWRLEGLDVFNKSQAKEVARRLNDSDYLKLRTSPGRV